jgi:hypothetical protein
VFRTGTGGPFEWFRFFHQPESGFVQVAQLGLARLILGKFYQVAALEEFAQTLFLVACQQFRSLQFVQKLFGGALGRVEIEPFLQIPTNRIGNENAKLTRLTKQRQSLLEFLFGAHVRWNHQHHRRLGTPLVPVTPGKKQQGCYRQGADGPTDKSPTTRDFDWRLNVA